MRLFAEKGYRSTTTAEIEGAAGLTPGAGGLYRHFDSKQAVVTAALEANRPSMAALTSAAALLPLGDLRSELTLLARGGLAGIVQSRDALAVIEREPSELSSQRDAAWDDVLEQGYQAGAALLVRLFESHGLEPPADPVAIATLAIGSLANFVRERESYGRTPGGLDEERLIAAWVDTWMAFALWSPAIETGDPKTATRV